MPLRDGFLLVHNTLVGAGVRDKIKIGVSGKIISAFDIARMLALGADWCNSARGFMFAVGCIQSRACHTNKCPTGVATQDPYRQRALHTPDKAQRVYNFHKNTRIISPDAWKMGKLSYYPSFIILRNLACYWIYRRAQMFLTKCGSWQILIAFWQIMRR